MPSGGEVVLDPLFERGQSQLFQPRDLALGEVVVGEIGERTAAEERERVGSVAVAQQRLEPLGIGSDPFAEDVAAAGGHDRVAPERAAEPRDERLQGLGRRDRRMLAPEVVDQPLRRQRLAAVDREIGEQRGLLAAAELHDPIALTDLERPENPDLHPARR